MKKTFDDYRLLGHSGTGSVWEGPDHLLYIETNGFLLPFSETYKRLDYAKIQSISYGRTPGFTAVTVFLLLLLALIGWGMWANRDETAAIVGFSIPLVPLLLALVFNLVKGPTCICKVQTAVQVLKLKPLNRLRPTMKAVARLNELCQFHQGGGAVTSEALIQATASGHDRREIPGSAKAPFPGNKLLTIGLPLIVFSGGLTIAELFVDHMAFFLFDSLVGLAAWILCIAGLARSLRYEVPASLKYSLWGIVVNVLFSFGLGYAVVMKATFSMMKDIAANVSRQTFNIPNEASIYRWMSHASLEELGVLGWLIIGAGSLFMVLGLLALPAALRPPGAADSSSPAPPALASETNPPPTEE